MLESFAFHNTALYGSIGNGVIGQELKQEQMEIETIQKNDLSSMQLIFSTEAVLMKYSEEKNEQKKLEKETELGYGLSFMLYVFYM